MILSDKTIRRMLDEQTLTIDPLADGQIQPASVDISPGRNPYRGKYQGQRGATGSRVFLDREV